MSGSGSTTFFQLIYGYLKIYLRFVTGKFSIQASQKLLYEEEHQ
jgi:ABC-type glutathione transport system ATPase component